VEQDPPRLVESRRRSLRSNDETQDYLYLIRRPAVRLRAGGTKSQGFRSLAPRIFAIGSPTKPGTFCADMRSHLRRSGIARPPGRTSSDPRWTCSLA
jgi:hypothetical protein